MSFLTKCWNAAWMFHPDLGVEAWNFRDAMQQSSLESTFERIRIEDGLEKEYAHILWEKIPGNVSPEYFLAVREIYDNDFWLSIEKQRDHEYVDSDSDDSTDYYISYLEDSKAGPFHEYGPGQDIPAFSQFVTDNALKLLELDQSIRFEAKQFREILCGSKAFVMLSEFFLEYPSGRVSQLQRDVLDKKMEQLSLVSKCVLYLRYMIEMQEVEMQEAGLRTKCVSMLGYITRIIQKLDIHDPIFQDFHDFKNLAYYEYSKENKKYEEELASFSVGDCFSSSDFAKFWASPSNRNVLLQDFLGQKAFISWPGWSSRFLKAMGKSCQCSLQSALWAKAKNVLEIDIFLKKTWQVDDPLGRYMCVKGVVGFPKILSTETICLPQPDCGKSLSAIAQDGNELFAKLHKLCAHLEFFEICVDMEVVRVFSFAYPGRYKGKGSEYGKHPNWETSATADQYANQKDAVFQFLLSLGVTDVINLDDELTNSNDGKLYVYQDEKCQGIHVHRVPTKDHSLVNHDHVLEKIRSYRQAPVPQIAKIESLIPLAIGIHCGYGWGRTGSAALVIILEVKYFSRNQQFLPNDIAHLKKEMIEANFDDRKMDELKADEPGHLKDLVSWIDTQNHKIDQRFEEGI